MTGIPARMGAISLIGQLADIPIALSSTEPKARDGNNDRGNRKRDESTRWAFRNCNPGLKLFPEMVY
ncbi:hypothetical protein KQX54_008756 [Cotesia glomerata]|uniref:Uncharacterized protein n=1 Tax=Cotesia glomerata TaxID=32391 RepID=A0AAV7HCC4_COTGL|nr:hypothetical protein KQX54_008756 [Cotesia glomerata]